MGMWDTLYGAGIWDQSPLGVAGGLCWAPKSLFLVLGLLLLSQGSVFPLPQAGVAVCPEPQDWHCHPLQPRFISRSSWSWHGLRGYHRRSSPAPGTWLTGLQGPPQPPYLPQPCSAGDKPNSLARGIICDPLVFKEFGFKKM